MAEAKYKDWLLPENLLRIQGWAMDGLTDAQIAENIGISTVTIWEWKKKYSNFANALKVSKDVADRQIENALFKAAKDGNITAQIFWLKNRKPDKWREQRREQEQQETPVINISLKGVSNGKTD
jgi:hypothetical protein